ncbi:hypothetical protein EW146_g1243 [Bondarzewia mesenterica]|uniref:Uncharacterized protein n=1 Tax=Bondarzewia mesenterica TaxID=1095465 RepID=A0A4S4M6T6_9AGAM|nr:hypothetical protein EW146_g1243 [Bondarzewia mesenterica]
MVADCRIKCLWSLSLGINLDTDTHGVDKLSFSIPHAFTYINPLSTIVSEDIEVERRCLQIRLSSRSDVLKMSYLEAEDVHQTAFTVTEPGCMEIFGFVEARRPVSKVASAIRTRAHGSQRAHQLRVRRANYYGDAFLSGQGSEEDRASRGGGRERVHDGHEGSKWA